MKAKSILIFFVLFTLLIFRCSEEENTTVKLNSFSPAQGAVGAVVTIVGENFSSQTTSVTFNNVPATISTSTPGQLEVKVPAGATTGKIAVLVNGERAESVSDFTVLNPPTISEFAPIYAWPGATVTISGTNFKDSPSGNVVKFGDVQAVISSASPTELKVTVPPNVSTSKINVTTDGITVSSALSFKSIIVTVSTFAGSGALGSLDGQGTQAQMTSPSGMYIDGLDNIYLCEKEGDKIRKITPTGMVSTIAGSTRGYGDGSSVVAKFNQPEGITMDGLANLYIADGFNNRIRKIASSGVVSTIAGDGTQGYLDGNDISAKLFNPTDIVADAHGNLIVSDFANHLIRKISPTGTVTTVAGSTSSGYVNGSSSLAKFNLPRGMIVDNAGNIYVADAGNHVIRKIDLQGQVTTVAGTGIKGSKDGKASQAEFSYPSDLAMDSQSNIYVADLLNSNIRMITSSGDVITIAGGSETGYVDGSGAQAKFFGVISLVLDKAGRIYVSDYSNGRIRKISIEYK